ncbi:hypothetical protein, unlikely [Trypanosoma brucei gambiense DAL972]|uniref:Uncharacterized protein n=1 Tax=Trypanosoma brucei gambiense (strain MHOM/CI/86/DAL972) TaxID=679716 RepID=C9ZTK6_TRYB9|nr:hypothetical protein, unlikely [Trypanosoma brucei gambiense DAL972]CBH12741.1 hypothetical protein, unlikely [Trypanosoma brucei gambiense DAL972]|eukprot:XP_011775021.1 hypothetical protein, unlikely [Trypanosoma brucei gambiense DAL972]
MVTSTSPRSGNLPFLYVISFIKWDCEVCGIVENNNISGDLVGWCANVCLRFCFSFFFFFDCYVNLVDPFYRMCFQHAYTYRFLSHPLFLLVCCDGYFVLISFCE